MPDAQRNIRGRWVLAFIVWLAAASTVQAQPRVVALHPLEVPSDLTDPEPVRGLLEAAIASRLEASGDRVVPARESGAIWKRLVESVQGFYDPITGDTVAAEYRIVHAGTLSELASRFGATHWLRPSLQVVRVEWDRGKAEWDGSSEGVAPVGRGMVGALSLVIVVEDTSGAVVASGRGGIQVLAKVKGQRYEDVPRGKLFADRRRINKSVELALTGFGGARP